MLFHHNPLFRIYFGDARDQIFFSSDSRSLDLESGPFGNLKKKLALEQLIFLNQVHGTSGEFLKTHEHAATLNPTPTDGDYLITTATHLGIGIFTADCLPIIYYDTFNQAIAIIHAGWRGSLSGIARVVFEKMEKEIGTQREHVRVFFGPSAHVCCYKVTQEFLAHLEPFACADQVIQKNGDSLFFDLPLFNRLLLEDYGIKRNAFHLDYNVCTIDNSSFYSYRRQGKSAGRQMTVACLV